MTDLSSTWKPDIVIYHDPCLDGFTAAWAVHKRWPEAEYVGRNYGQAAPEILGKHVLIVDFSYKRTEIEELARGAASIVVLDHHKTAQAELEPFTAKDGQRDISPGEIPSILGNLAAIGKPPVIANFDMQRSGARMAWDFAHGDLVPMLVQLVEDRDLWRFDMGDVTRNFHLRLSIERKTFDAWSEIDAQMREDTVLPVQDGAAMRQYRDWLVEQICERAEVRPIVGHSVPVVDCPYELASDVGDRLCQIYSLSPFAAMRTHSTEGTSYSLRSRNGFDVSDIAKHFGGGGHAAAAGFRVPACI